jgi:transposase InsO family protein
MTYFTKQFIIKQRYLMIQDYKEHITIVDIARKYRVSRTTVYRWIWRYELYGKEGLLNRSNRPKTPHPNALPIRTTKAIIRLRKKTKYGPRRIRLRLLKRGLKVSEYAIYRTLQRNNLIKKHKNRKRKYKRVYIKEPGKDVQIDTKHLDRPAGKPYRYYQYTATDAATRIRVLRIYDELSAYNATRFLKEVVKQLPFRVLAVRTDNGVEFTYGPFKKDHPFTLECVRLGIKHKLNRPAHPQSNGKCERSHRTDEEEFYRRYPAKDPRQWQYRLPTWEHEYNYQRPHQALGDITPYQAWLNYKKKVSENVT